MLSSVTSVTVVCVLAGQALLAEWEAAFGRLAASTDPDDAYVAQTVRTMVGVAEDCVWYLDLWVWLSALGTAWVAAVVIRGWTSRPVDGSRP